MTQQIEIKRLVRLDDQNAARRSVLLKALNQIKHFILPLVKK